jgi:hypothetical protein
MEIIFSEYFAYKAQLRGFVLTTIENIVKYSTERYFDTVTGRMVVIGNHDRRLVMIPYEAAGDVVTPVTIHATTRQQITFRIKTGRFIYE